MFIVEHLTINMKHTTLSYIYLINILHFKFAPNIPVHTTLSILHIVYFAYYFCIIRVLSCCCHSVALWSFCHQNKFLVCVTIPGNKAHSDSDYKNPLENLEGTSGELVFTVLVWF